MPPLPLFLQAQIVQFLNAKPKTGTGLLGCREGFVFGCETGTIADCVSRAIASTTAPVILAGSGDNPTGGGVGDRADVLAELIKQQAQGVIFAGITDAPALEKMLRGR